MFPVLLRLSQPLHLLLQCLLPRAGQGPLGPEAPLLAGWAVSRVNKLWLCISLFTSSGFCLLEFGVMVESSMVDLGPQYFHFRSIRPTPLRYLLLLETFAASADGWGRRSSRDVPLHLCGMMLALTWRESASCGGQSTAEPSSVPLQGPTDTKNFRPQSGKYIFFENRKRQSAVLSCLPCPSPDRAQEVLLQSCSKTSALHPGLKGGAGRCQRYRPTPHPAIHEAQHLSFGL